MRGRKLNAVAHARRRGDRRAAGGRSRRTSTARRSNGTEIRVVFLENADAEQLLPVLQQLVGQTPDAAAARRSCRARARSSSSIGGSGDQRFAARTTDQPRRSPQRRSAATTTTRRHAGDHRRAAGAPRRSSRASPAPTRSSSPRPPRSSANWPRSSASSTRAANRCWSRRSSPKCPTRPPAELGAQFLLGACRAARSRASTFYATRRPISCTIAGAIGARQLATTTTTVNGTDARVTDAPTTPRQRQRSRSRRSARSSARPAASAVRRQDRQHASSARSSTR